MELTVNVARGSKGFTSVSASGTVTVPEGVDTESVFWTLADKLSDLAEQKRAQIADENPAVKQAVTGAPVAKVPQVTGSDTLVQEFPKRGGGTLRFQPTSQLGFDDFKDAVRAALAEKGADPDLYFIWDDRGKVEKGEEKYDFCNVYCEEAHPLHEAMVNPKNPQYQRQAFYVNFAQDGAIYVRPTKAYTEALAAHNVI